ncbi:MAG TPA: ATP-dependent DNA helicase RecG [Aquimonas sp.]|jgi:ATP-dependent DNA helicase RecG|nr:ATP-dependent DNA helicase RecG [Aquimonas sp.]
MADCANTLVRTLSGVGPQVEARLARAGIHHLSDLWFLLPRGYEDRTRITPLDQLQAGESAQIEGRIEEVERGFRFRPQLKVALSDDTLGGITLRFFHFNAAQVQQFTTGAWLRCHGEVRWASQGLEMVHPSYRRIREEERGQTRATLDPVYPSVDGVGPAMLGKLVRLALQSLRNDAALELLPLDWLRKLGLPDLIDSLQTLHAPTPGTNLSALVNPAHPARRRLIVEELLAHRLSLARQRSQIRRLGALPLRSEGRLVAAFQRALPFALTGAQRRVWQAIRDDLCAAEPMLRLVQGDVGSGKTVVAALAALQAIEAGTQAALMAPTELLAEQHFVNFQRWLQPLGVDVVWLAGKVKGRQRNEALQRVAAGAPMIIGTHALMQDAVRYQRLSLAIIDEQHRFGVHQRLALRDKGHDGESVPHQLVMTATPIPRTLAMTSFADLDVSNIDELPPGRTPVQTVAIEMGRRTEVIERIRAACAAGRQAYWVCTLIEDSDEIEAQAAQSTFDTLSAALSDMRIGLVHGRMKAADKQAVMQAFKSGEMQLLVATTVIEVGVDVPNASLMIIENAERLGLAQLHQLRGRVGRGAAQSSCVLMYQPPLSRLARERLDVLRRSNDGFLIAEKDLELRGPGEFLGTRQTGEAGFRIANPMRDTECLDLVDSLMPRVLQLDGRVADALIARWIGAAERYADV